MFLFSLNFNCFQCLFVLCDRAGESTVVFKKKVLIVDYLSGRYRSLEASEKSSSDDGIYSMPLVMVLIGQFCHDVIGWLLLHVVI